MNKLEAEIFGKYVSINRRINGWTIEGLAKASNFAYSTIRNIEQGISNIDEESRNKIARLFGYERFMNNLNQKKLYKKILDHILYLHSTAQINEMLEYLKKILKNEELQSSFLFFQYHLLHFYYLVYTGKDCGKRKQLKNIIEENLYFFSNEEIATFYDLLYIDASENDLNENVTHLLLKAYDYNPNSFLINIHLVMNLQRNQYLAGSLTYLENCKRLLYSNNSIYRFMQIGLLEASIMADNGERAPALHYLFQLLHEAERYGIDIIKSSILDNITYTCFVDEDYFNTLKYSLLSLERKNNRKLDHYFYIAFSQYKLNNLTAYKQGFTFAKKMLLGTPYLYDLLLGLDYLIKKDLSKAIEHFETAAKNTEERMILDWSVWIWKYLCELFKETNNFEKYLFYQQKIEEIYQRRTSTFQSTGENN